MKMTYPLMVLLSIFTIGASTSGFCDNNSQNKVIKIGNTGPYTGPVASYSRVLKTINAYFKMINDKGGINGRKIQFISYDDQYNPKKSAIQVKKLVEKDKVLFTLFTIGTSTNLAIRDYMNDKKVPQLFAGSGAYLFDLPEEFPWTNPGVADYKGEASLYAKYLLKNHPKAKVAILYQNDDYGKLYLESFLKTLDKNAKEMIVAQESYTVRDKDLHKQIEALKASGADTFISISTPRFAIQTINIMSEMKWNPLHILALPVASRENVFAKVGYEKTQGAITAQITKDPANPSWAKDQDMINYKKFMKTYVPKLDPNDVFIIAGYLAASLGVEVLKECGDDLTRENIIKVRNRLIFKAPLLLPGITVQLSPNDLRLVKEMQIVKFEGDSWQPIDKPMAFEAKEKNE